MMTSPVPDPGSSRTAIRIAGKSLDVPSATICGWPIVVVGRWLRVAQLNEEEILEGNLGNDVAVLVAKLKESRLRSDIFVFAQRLPESEPKHPYYFEWDNWAVASITTFEAWWNKLPQESRKNVRRSSKRGIIVRLASFDDRLVSGIQEIYNETPVRQGRPFWHFGKDITTVHSEMETHVERSDFIGAYLNDELVGFIKLTYINRIAMITQIIAKNAYREARPMNALVARAVELCESKKMAFLVYGKYVYGRHTKSPLTEFKRRNGFQELRVPRYFVPLTTIGQLALSLGFHSSFRDRLPTSLVGPLLGLRSGFYRLFDHAKAR
jgi:hypothetical protein